MSSDDSPISKSKRTIDKIIASVTPDNRSEMEKAVDRVFGNITKASAAKQVVVGGGTGWVTGYLAVKIGKYTAITLGASLFVLQVAQHKGLVKVNWTKVHHAVGSVRDSALSLIDDMQEDAVTTVKRFYNDNFFLAAGFTGGLTAGIFF